MESSGLVPYQPQPSQNPSIRYTVDFGRGPVNIVFGRQGIYATPLDSLLDGPEIMSIAAEIVFAMSELKKTNYYAFVHGVNTLIQNLSREDASELSLEEMTAVTVRGPVTEDDLIEMVRIDKQKLTPALKDLYKKFLGIDYKQLPLPLQFESEGRQLSLPIQFKLPLLF